MAKESRNDKRVARHQRIRKNVYGTPEKPRLCVFRSSKNISVQVIDDVNGVTLASKRALAKGIEEVTFDRGGFLYHGRVKELADGAREAGLKF